MKIIIHNYDQKIIIKIYKDSALWLLCNFLNSSYSLNKQKLEVTVDALQVQFMPEKKIRNSRKCIYTQGKVSTSKDLWQGLPWWRSGRESACQCRGHGFEPWSGKIPHAAEQLGPWATITEPARLEPVLRNKRGHDSDRPAHRNEEWSPLAATRESPRTETKTQHSQK